MKNRAIKGLFGSTKSFLFLLLTNNTKRNQATLSVTPNY